MYEQGTDNIILVIDEQNNCPQGFDNAMMEIREQLDEFDTYYVYSTTVGNYAMVHTFYNINRNVVYYITDQDVILAMAGEEIDFIANYLEEKDERAMLEKLGFYEDDDDDDESLIDWNVADEYTLSHYSNEQYAELQFEYYLGVYEL